MKIIKTWEEKDEDLFMIRTGWEGKYFTYCTSYLRDADNFTLSIISKKDIFEPDLICGKGLMVSFDCIKINLERPHQFADFADQINELIYAADFFAEKHDRIREESRQVIRHIEN